MGKAGISYYNRLTISGSVHFPEDVIIPWHKKLTPYFFFLLHTANDLYAALILYSIWQRYNTSFGDEFNPNVELFNYRCFPSCMCCCCQRRVDPAKRTHEMTEDFMSSASKTLRRVSSIPINIQEGPCKRTLNFRLSKGCLTLLLFRASKTSSNGGRPDEQKSLSWNGEYTGKVPKKENIAWDCCSGLRGDSLLTCDL